MAADKKSEVSRWFSYFAGVALLVFLDQITKIAAVKYLASGPFVLVKGVFELRYLENKGAAFGILQGQKVFFLMITIAFIAAALYIYRRIPMTRRFLPLRVLAVFVSAGAAGNLIDRVLLNYVRDFLYFSLIDFPIFNVADIYVTLSAAALFILVMFYYKDDEFEFMNRKAAKAEENSSGPEKEEP